MWKLRLLPSKSYFLRFFHRKVTVASPEGMGTKADQVIRTVNEDVLRWFYQEEKLLGIKFPAVQFLHKSKHKKIRHKEQKARQYMDP
jgi:hemerythrin